MKGKNKVCISYSGSKVEEVDMAARLCKYLELRLDLCLFTELEYKSIFEKNNTFIVADHSHNRKNNLLDALILGAEIIDIDYNHKYFDYLYQFSKDLNKKIIISYHNYEEFSNLKYLNHFIEFCFDKNADYCKIACKLNTKSELIQFTQLFNNDFVNNTKTKLLAMGLGKYGPISRILSLNLNSPFIYCSFTPDNKTADGQIDVFDFYKLYSKLIVE